jgi:hypothetical protein
MIATKKKMSENFQQNWQKIVFLHKQGFQYFTFSSHNLSTRFSILGFLRTGFKRGFIRTCLVTNKFIISKCFVFRFSLQNWPNLRGARFLFIDEWARIVLFGFWTNSKKLIQSQIYFSDKMAISKFHKRSRFFSVISIVMLWVN